MELHLIDCRQWRHVGQLQQKHFCELCLRSCDYLTLSILFINTITLDLTSDYKYYLRSVIPTFPNNIIRGLYEGCKSLFRQRPFQTYYVNVVQNCRPCSFPIRQTLRIALEIIRIWMNVGSYIFCIVNFWLESFSHKCTCLELLLAFQFFWDGFIQWTGLPSQTQPRSPGPSFWTLFWYKRFSRTKDLLYRIGGSYLPEGFLNLLTNMSFSELPRVSWRFIFTPLESIKTPGPGGFPAGSFRVSCLLAEAVGSFRHIASFYENAC